MDDGQVSRASRAPVRSGPSGSRWSNGRCLLGDKLFSYFELRPPLVPILELPALALVRASTPGSAVRIVAPHLTAAIVSLLSAAAVWWAFRRVFSVPYALLGTLLFVGGRFFVRYGAHVMAGDAKGNLYIGETYEGKRVQKFTYRGLGPAQMPIIQ